MTVYQRVVIIAAVCLCMGGIMMLLDVPFMTRGVFDNNEELQNRFFRMIERR